MAVELSIPRLGRDMESGRIAEWYLPDGATVHRGQPVYCVETDYVAFEVEAEAEGVVRHTIPAGAEAAPGDVAGRIVQPEDRQHAAPPTETEEAPLRIRRAGEPGIVRRHGSLAMARDAMPDWGTDEAARPATKIPGPVPLRPGAAPENHREQRRPEPEAAALASEPEHGVGEPAALEPELVAVEEEGGLRPRQLPVVVSPVAIRAGMLVMRTTVSLAEAQKMCGQLTREWEASHLTCTLEDVLARAIARTLDAELLGSEVDGRKLRVVAQDLHTSRSADLREPGTRIFKELVAERLASTETDAIRNWPRLATYAGTGVEDAQPRLEDGDIAGFTLGDPRETEKGPVATFALSYAEEAVSEAQAANFLARVRELIEAPYALLAE